MTTPVLPLDDRRDRYVVTNPAGQSLFTYTFPVDVDIDNNVGIAVYVNDVLVAASGYTVNTIASSVTLNTPAAQNAIVVLQGATIAQRIVDYPLRGGLPSARLNEEMERIFYLVQELLRDRGRSFVLAPSAGDNVSATLPTPEAGKVLVGNSTATGFENKTPTTLNLALVSAFVSTLIDDVDATAFLTTLGSSALGRTLFAVASAAAARSAIGAAASGANSDITSLTALTVPLAPLASPALTGTPTAPTAAAATNTTQLATTAFVQQEKVIRQQVRTVVVTSTTGATALPDDDTKPQNTEGTEFMTRAITPISSSSILLIEAQFFGSTAAIVDLTAALFQDSAADALAAGSHSTDTGAAVRPIPITHSMTAGTTSSTTFKVRAGSSSGTTTFNGTNGNRRFGGVLGSSIIITELAA